MKLLFDENLSPALPRLLADLFPASVHVRDVGLKHSPDQRVWDYAITHGLTIVSKDDDFRQRALLHGPPPKVVGLLLGNCTADEAYALLRTEAQVLKDFAADPQAAYLAVQR